MSPACLIRTILWLSLLLLPSSFAQSKSSASIRGAQWIEPIVTAPTGHGIAGFSFPPQEGEHSSGTPFVVSTSGRSPRVYRLKTEVLDSDGIVWSGRPNELYLSTDGIYMWRLGQVPRKLWSGATAGLAISNDGRRLAFWNLETVDAASHELVTFDIDTARELHRWKVNIGWNKDEHYFDVWFGTDGNVAYARTFELEDTRPIRAFEIDTGKTSIVTTNGVCLAETADGTFYIEAKGPYYVVNDRYDLFRLTNRTQGDLVKSNIPAQVCTGNRRARLLAGVQDKRVWVYDTLKGKFTSFPTTCDNVAVFSDGSLLFARKNRLMWGKCK